MQTCEHCGERPIEGAGETWYVYGILLFAWWGKEAWISCGPCHRRKAAQRLLLTSVLGWWCFPWGLGTPIVMVQNIAALVGGPSKERLAALQQALDADERERAARLRQVVSVEQLDDSFVPDASGAITLVIRPAQKPFPLWAVAGAALLLLFVGAALGLGVVDGSFADRGETAPTLVRVLSGLFGGLVPGGLVVALASQQIKSTRISIEDDTIQVVQDTGWGSRTSTTPLHAVEAIRATSYGFELVTDDAPQKVIVKGRSSKWRIAVAARLQSLIEVAQGAAPGT